MPDGTVWVFFLHTKEDDDVSLYTTKELADAAVYEFVKYWWDIEMPADEDIPEDPADAIESYFEFIDHEWYFVNEQAVISP